MAMSRKDETGLNSEDIEFAQRDRANAFSKSLISLRPARFADTLAMNAKVKS